MSNTSTTPQRPGHVAVACAIAVVCSVLVVVSAWDTLGNLHSLDTRHQLQSAMSRAGVRGSGLTLSDLTVVMKVVTMAVAGCAAAIAALTIETMRRSRWARVAMTVLAVPLFLGGLVSGGIFSTAVAVAVSTLWYGPARGWFDGVPATGRTSRQAKAAASPPSRRAPSTDLRPQAWSPPSTPPSSPPNSSPSTPPPWTPPPTSAYDVRTAPRTAPRSAPGSPPRSTSGSAPRRRPTPLTVACLVTWLSCALTGILAGLTVLVLAVDSQGVLDRTHAQDPSLARSGLSDHQVVVVAFVLGSLVLVWSLTAAAVAVLAFRGRRWAWHTLLGSTAAVAVLGVLAVLGSAVVLVPIAASLLTIALLLRPEVKAWFSG